MQTWSLNLYTKNEDIQKVPILRNSCNNNQMRTLISKYINFAKDVPRRKFTKFN